MRSIALILALMLSAASAQFLNTNNMTVFRIESHNFSRTEIDSKIKSIADIQAQHLGRPLNAQEIVQIKPMVVNQILSEELLNLDSKRMGVVVSRKSVDSVYGMYRKQSGGDKQLTAQLKKSGLSPASLRKSIEGQILMARVLEKITTVNQSLPSNKEIEQFYEANKAHFAINDTIYAARILLKSSGADAKTLLDGLAAQVRLKKAMFQMLAIQYSEDPKSKARGGVLPPFLKTAYGADCAAAFKSAKTRDVTRVCRSKEGSNLFYIISLNDGRLESYKDRIIQRMMMERQEVYQQKFQEYIRGLMSRYVIQFFDPSYDPRSSSQGASQGAGQMDMQGALDPKAGPLTLPKFGGH